MAKVKRSDLNIPNKKGAGRPMEVPKVQINRRINFLHVGGVTALLDLVKDHPELIPVLLETARTHLQQAHSPQNQGTPGNY